MTTLKEIMGKHRELKDLYQAAGKKIVQQYFKTWFEEHPDTPIQGFYWNQYTPYFMDGDPCVFSIGEIFALKNILSKDEVEELGSYPDENENVINGYNSCDEDSTIKEDIQSVEKDLTELQDSLQEVFGDHVSVYVDKQENCYVVECEHD